MNRNVVEACVEAGVFERPPQPNIQYKAGLDMSGGSVDSAALCIAHNDESKQSVVIDCIRERRAPHSPEQVIEEFAGVLKSYGIYKAVSDRYGGSWPTEAFSRFNITVEPADRNKSQIYVDFLPLINSARVKLLDDERSVAQLCSLERKVGRGREHVDHPPNSHDDRINAVALAAVSSVSPWESYDVSYSGFGYGDRDDDPDGARAFRVARLLEHIGRFG